MEASVLPLSWPADFDPLDHKRFETDARTLRYQALGRACRAAGIYNLLVAHHADDQAETVLMRLANGRLRLGLQAMQPVEWIPECHGLHGVSHSGTLNGKFGDSTLEHLPFPVENGGVKILRPLLNFSKARLITTCKRYDVSWAEDKTNQLRTHTSRNAIRHVLQNRELPAALSVQSLVDVSKHMQQRVAKHKDRADRIFFECKIQLDIRTGSLHVHFPPFRRVILDILVTRKPTEALTRSDLVHARDTATFVLARVGQLISPRESPPLAELAAIVGNIWPEFRDLQEADPPQIGASENSSSFCVYGIWWRKWAKSSGSVKEEDKMRSDDLGWFLARQPVENQRSSWNSIIYPSSHVVPLTQDILPAPTSKGDNEYQLFDNRWWISIRNNSTDELRLRLFTKDDLTRLRSRDTERQTAGIATTALSLLRTADLRLNLPAIFRFNAATKKEHLVGLPTLDVSVGNHGFYRGICTWRVHYKKVELGVEELAAMTVPGVTRELIEDKMEKVSRSLRARREYKGKMEQKEKMQTLFLEKNRKSPARWRERKEGRNTLVPITESNRRGKSEQRDEGGYDIKWKDVGDRP